MAGEKVERAEWRDFFYFMLRSVVVMLANIDVVSVAPDDPAESEWLPLLGITYDPGDDVLEITLEGVGRMIRSPQEVWVAAEAGELLSFQVVDSEGALQIVQLRAPLMLPTRLAALD
jgi:hypothetical protein